MTIKELAGHSNLATTERYMHLRQVDKDEAVALLALTAKRTEERNVRAGDAASDASASGEILEKREPETAVPKKTETNSKI